MRSCPNLLKTILRPAALTVAVLWASTAQAQLVSGLELGLNSVKLFDVNQAKPAYGRDRGVLNGTRIFFGSQRNWTSLGWIADIDYQSGATDHVGPSKDGYAVASSGAMRVLTVAATLNWPMKSFDSGSIALAPRLAFRNLVRQADAAPNLLGNSEDYQEGIAALGLLLNGDFDRNFGVSAKVEIERPFSIRQSTSFTSTNAAVATSQLQSSPNPLWRPQLELSAWYRINPRHSLIIKARSQDFSTGTSDSFDAGSTNPANLTALPGQKIRMNSLRAGWAYHF